MNCSNNSCKNKPESDAHILMKQVVYNMCCKYVSLLHFIGLEHVVGNQIADVLLVTGTNKEKIAIECQRSNLTFASFQERTRGYTKKNISVLWILDANGHCVTKRRNFYSVEISSISAIEKELHKMHKGRVYYIDTDIDKPQIYSLSFIDIGYKNTFLIVPGQTINLPKFLFSFNNGSKIASFYDKHVKTICENEIKSYIKLKKKVYSQKKCHNCEHFYEYKKENRLNPKCAHFRLKERTISHIEIMNKFHERFGVGLVNQKIRQFIYEDLIIETSEKCYTLVTA